MRLVYGVGFNDGKYPAKINGKKTKEYRKWHSMLERCYCEKSLKKYPTYIGCTVSENFKSYSYFYEWCQNQIGFGVDGFELDKDLLIKGNKTYSEELCVFIPRSVNVFFTKSNRNRGNYPIGVLLNKASGKFISELKINGKKKHLGLFDNCIDAFKAYKQNKESHLKFLAEKYKDVVSNRSYAAMIDYRVSIND